MTTTIEWLTIDGVDYHEVPVSVFQIVPTQEFGPGADNSHTTDTHVGFAKLGADDIRILAGQMREDGTIAWESRA